MSSCGLDVHYEPEILANYNILSVDQRGIGHSFPLFDRCLPDYAGDYVRDITDEQEIRASLRRIKLARRACWKREEFKFATPDGGEMHFLDHSGTHSLAHDLDRARAAGILRTVRWVAVTESLEIGWLDRKLPDVINIIGMRLGGTSFGGIIFTQVNVGGHTMLEIRS